MLQSFAAGKSFINIDAHQPADEIFSGIADVVPIRRIEFEFACNLSKCFEQSTTRYFRCLYWLLVF